MKRKTKSLISLLIALVLTISGAVMVFGEAVTEDDFKVVVTTDKDSYQEGEKIQLSFSIIHNAEATVSRVGFQYVVSDEIKNNILNFDKMPTSLTKLDTGLNEIFDSKEVDKPDDNKSDTNKPDADKPGTGNSGTGNAGTGTPGTGDNSNVKLYVGILLVVAGIVLAMRAGCMKKFASLFMVVAMVAGLNAASLVTVNAATENMMVAGEKTITYAGVEETITVVAYLTMKVEGDGVEDDDSGNDDSESAELNISPTDLAKLLLANERLDSEELTSENKFFAPSKAVAAFNNLKIMTLSTTSGQCEKYSNEMGYFESYIRNVEMITLDAADTIDYVKENIGCVDVWVEYGGIGGELLLQVTDNEERLIMKSDTMEYICRRYTDDNGDDVYEIYREEKQNSDNYYLLCIPDKRYEYSVHITNNTLDDTTDDMNDYVVVENSRGYWNMFTASYVYDNGNDRYNVQNLVAGNEFAYVYYGDVRDKNNGGYKSMDHITFITPELDSDLISVYDYDMGVNLVGFNGVASFETDDNNFITSFTTTGGKTINVGAKIADNIEFYHGVVEQGQSKYPVLQFKMLDNNGNALPMSSEAATNILQTLKENGIVCKAEKDLDGILSAIDGCYGIADNFGSYYNWNGHYLTDLEALESAVAVGREKQEALIEKFDNVKDAEKVEVTSGGINYANYDFAKLTLKDAEAVTFENGKVTINGLQTEVAVADVMMDGEKYELQYALAATTSEEGKYGSAILINTEEDGVATYSDANLSLEKSAEFEIPACTSAGVYTLVVYVATSDGIRVSEMVPITFTADASFSGISNGYEIDIKLNDADEMVVSYTLANEYWVEVADTEDTIAYDEVYELLLAEVYKYGYPNIKAILEVYDVETGESREATHNESLNGLVCRLAYDIPNMTAMTGYVYVELP